MAAHVEKQYLQDHLAKLKSAKEKCLDRSAKLTRAVISNSDMLRDIEAAIHRGERRLTHLDHLAKMEELRQPIVLALEEFNEVLEEVAV